jgi:nitrile hydratase
MATIEIHVPDIGDFDEVTVIELMVKPGDTVRARTMHPSGHTRLPRYVRGRIGTVMSVHGAHVYPETHATPAGDPSPRWLYTVRFEARELWGEDTTASAVHVDAWEPYLEPLVAGAGR